MESRRRMKRRRSGRRGKCRGDEVAPAPAVPSSRIEDLLYII